jgi:branched-subunit amino acid aminotransferase/4-amino-4-deoxychorismate lyase
MNKCIIHNGQLVNADTSFINDNRAFRYGDGLFETMRIIAGKPHNLNAHLARLQKGMEVLGIEIPANFLEVELPTAIFNCVQANELTQSGKMRLQVFRDGRGTYLSESDQPAYIITLEEMPSNLFVVNSEGLKVDLYQDIKKPRNVLSNLKTSNGLLYIMALNYAKKNKLDEAILMNTEGNIIESAQSNIILVSNGVLYTPPLSDGCVGGTMRMKVINTALANNIKVYESSLNPQNMLIADEVILTNAIRGLQWVGHYKSKQYGNLITRKLVTLVNESIVEMAC